MCVREQQAARDQYQAQEWEAALEQVGDTVPSYRRLGPNPAQGSLFFLKSHRFFWVYAFAFIFSFTYMYM